MNREKIQTLAYIGIVIIAFTFIGYAFFKYIFFAVLPFLIAWAVAFSVRPLAYKLSDLTHIPPKIVSLVLTIFLVLAILGLTSLGIVLGIKELVSLVENNNMNISDILDKILNPFDTIIKGENREQIIEKITDALIGMANAALNRLMDFIGNFIGSVPRVALFILATVISALYFSLDLDGINKGVLSIFNEDQRKKIVNFKNNFLKILLKYLRSYLIIMILTFVVMLVGFLILRVEYQLILALVVAVLDALPLLGVGVVLIPWSIYSFIWGDVFMCVGLILLLVVHQIIRQIAEPKILGKNLGLHPVLSIILLYTGYYFFGFLGLLLIPVFTAIMNVIIKKEDSAEIG